MPTDESEYFRVILSEDKYFDASQGSFVEIIIGVPQKPRPRRRSDTQIPLIRLAVRLMIEHGITGNRSVDAGISGRCRSAYGYLSFPLRLPIRWLELV
jgi:hypothetical protein